MCQMLRRAEQPRAAHPRINENIPEQNGEVREGNLPVHVEVKFARVFLEHVDGYRAKVAKIHAAFWIAERDRILAGI